MALGLVSFLLWYGIGEMPGSDKSFMTLWKLGLGAVTPATFISWGIPSGGTVGIIGNVLAANAAQPILSFLYFTLNGLFTCMLLANEWSKYSVRRKGLRVSTIPMGAQRTSYTLQLPYRFAFPLMLASGVLHWLVSQSIFLVSVESYKAGDGATTSTELWDSYMTCGYSPAAMMCVVVVGAGLVSATIGFGFRRYRTGMPVAGSCSVAIAAACMPQPGRDEDGAAFEPVQWGVSSGVAMGGIGHCCFTKGPVQVPLDGAFYRGEKGDTPI